MKGILTFAATGGVVALLAIGFLALTDAGPALATHVDAAGHVYVSNQPGEAVPVRTMDGRTPFTVYLSGSWSSGQYQSSKSFTVASGKRLVIEYASLEGFSGSGSHASVELVTPSSPSNGHYFFERTSPFTSGFTVAQPMRAYANAGSSTLILSRNATSGTGQWEATIVGYLIPTT